MNIGEESPSFFKEKHDAYKSLISSIAEQLRPEDLGNIFWYTDAPPDKRSNSALEVLEHLQRLGKFSEKTTVQYLSQLMKDIKRIDLMKEVDSYSHNYVRHFSLPAVTVNPPPQPPRSYSFGNHFASSTPFPCQETRPFLAYARHSTPQDTSRGQAQHGSHLASVASGVSENTRLTRQPFPVASPAQSYSMERLPHSRLPGSAGVLAHGLASPTLEPNDRQNMGNLTGSRSLSNSGSIHLHYNSHPSSCNTSQEAFQSEPPSVFMPYAEQGHFVGEVHTNSATGVQMPLEYYNNISRPHSLSFPHQVHPHWYQHASLSSIPQESENTSHLVGQVTCNPRTPHKQQYTAPYGTVNERPHSQESLFSRHPQQAQPMHYYSTPPYNRRAPVMVGPVNRGASRMRHQSVGGYPVRTDPSNQSLPKYRAAQEGGYDKHYNNIQASNKLGEPGDEVFVHPSSHHSSKEAAVNLPSTATNKLERENKCDVNPLNSKDYLRQSPCDLNKAMAHIEENLLANNSDEVVHRRRANSLHQESEYKAQKRNNRLSCVSVDERRSVHQDPDNRAQRSNNRLSFMSVDERRPNNHQSIQRSASASSNAIGSIRQIGDSRGSVVHSSGTLDSDDSPTASPLSSSRTNSHAHRQKGTLLSRLTQQFSRVVKPHKEIEWPIKRNKLNKIIYEQKDKYLTCPFRLELDGGLKGSNPKLTLYVHPYGREEDSNQSMTLEIGLEVPTQPNSPRLNSRAMVEVNVKADDADRKVVFGSRTVRESVRLNYFYMKGFVSHQQLKQSHSSQVLFTISANLIGVV